MNLCVEHGGLLVKLFPVSTTTSLRMFLCSGAFLGGGGKGDFREGMGGLVAVTSCQTHTGTDKG